MSGPRKGRSEGCTRPLLRYKVPCMGKKRPPNRSATRRPAPVAAPTAGGIDWSRVGDPFVTAHRGMPREEWEDVALARNPRVEIRYVAGRLAALEDERLALLERRDRAVARARAMGEPWAVVAQDAGVRYQALAERLKSWGGSL